MKYRIREQNELKPSGVEWLGDIPKDWEVTKLKRFIINIIGGVWGNNQENNENDVICLRVADIDYDKLIFNENNFTIRNISNTELKSRILRKNDLVIEKSGGGEKTPVGRVVLYNLEEKAVCSNFMNKISIDNQVMNSKFLVLIFNSLYSQRVVLESIKQTTGIQNLDVENYISNYISYPNIIEQQKIADFLDEKSKIFDEAISKKEQLISKLELAKQSLISEVVTGKLKIVEQNSKLQTIKREENELKPSGVEWLGDIPKDWIKTKLKYHCSIKGRIGFKGFTKDDLVEKNKGALVLGATEIMDDGKINLSKVQYISWDKYYESPEIMIKKDELLIVQRGSTVGKVAFINEIGKEATINPSLVLLKNINIEVKYLFYFLKSSYIKNIITVETSSTAIPMISQTQISNYVILKPFITEQQKISKYLDEKLIHFDNTIEKTKESITKLKEAKEALISQTVTGKIEVL